MDVLLLGANGQLGSDIRRAAPAHPALRITALTRAELDLADAAAIAPALAARRFDAVINATGYHRTDEVESNAGLAVAVNAHAVGALAGACAAHGARLLHVSTDYVFDGLAGRPYREDDATAPLNVYGATKLMGEGLARTAHDDVVVFRVASLFGVAGASGKGGNFVETMIRVGTERGALRVVADQVMSPTATADIAVLALRALEERIPAGVYHAVGSGSASWHAFAARIIERAGVAATVDPIPASEYPTPARRPAMSALDNGRLAALLGPIPDWRDALDRYLAARG